MTIGLNNVLWKTLLFHKTNKIIGLAAFLSVQN
jgi:hypothetical protein